MKDLIPDTEEPQSKDLIPQENAGKPAGFGGFLANKYGGAKTAVPGSGADNDSFSGLLASKYGAPTQPAQEPKQAKEGGDFGRGFKEAYQQIPQLGHGLQAIAGATIESVAGEGGLGAAIKKSGVEGFQKAGEEIAKDAKPSDSWNFAYDKAKQGDFGSLVDWLQHGLGYVGGQATQMLVTAGIGTVGGKLAANTAAKKIAEGMVAKEAAKITGTEAGKKLTADEVKQIATKAVTDKFSRLGQNAALASTAVGMEGGEIGGDLAAKSVQEGRTLTGAELGKAFAATLAAGGLEFVGDKLGLDILLGRSPLLKPAGSMPGVTGRVARGAIAGAGAAPIEASTEFGQTLIEEYGKGNNPLSDETIHHAQDAAALGALGGGAIGGMGGVMSGAKETEAKPEPAIPTINGRPVTEHSDTSLKYAANRGGERAKAAAQAEIQRRKVQGVDPAVANAPETTGEAVDRIVATGKEKAQEIRNSAIADNPTPEPVETLNAQLTALAEGRKPGVLLTPGEPLPNALPQGVQLAEIPGRGTLLYRDNATLQAAMNGQMGTALGYGI